METFQQDKECPPVLKNAVLEQYYHACLAPHIHRLPIWTLFHSGYFELHSERNMSCI